MFPFCQCHTGELLGKGRSQQTAIRRSLREQIVFSYLHLSKFIANYQLIPPLFNLNDSLPTPKLLFFPYSILFSSFQFSALTSYTPAFPGAERWSHLWLSCISEQICPWHRETISSDPSLPHDFPPPTPRENLCLTLYLSCASFT